MPSKTKPVLTSMNGLPPCSHFVRLSLALGLAFLLACFLVTSATAAPQPTPEKRYEDAKEALQRLQENPRAAASREPWRKLSDIFLQLYKTNPSWKNRPAALFRAGLTLDEMLRRTRPEPQPTPPPQQPSTARPDPKSPPSSPPVQPAEQDAEVRATIALYDQLISAHPDSVLADDALFRIARLKAEFLDDRAGAEVLLKRIQTEFATGDMIRNALNYQKRLASGPVEKEVRQPPTIHLSANPAALTQVAWQTRRNTVRVALNTDRPVAWVVSALPENRKLGTPSRLVVDLLDTIPSQQIKPGVKITESPLRRLRIDLSAPGRTRLLLDFSALRRFDVQLEGAQLIVTAATVDSMLPRGSRPGETLNSNDPGGMSMPSDLARQLGLTVGTVLLDPGHGGKDPGAEAEGIVESEMTLDLIRRVGDILTQNGLRVHYTRTDNTWISLEARSIRATEIKADLMVSIHVNASTNKSASGFETYYLNFASSSEAVKLAGVENAMSERKLGELEGLLADLMLGARTQESRRMAETIQRLAVEGLRKKDYDTHDGGIKSAPFHVLLASGIPGVLVEVGYCTNQEEARRLASPAYRAVIAEGIASGILAYAGKLE